MVHLEEERGESLAVCGFFDTEKQNSPIAREEKELACRCGKGDTDAFEILVSRYEKRIFAMAVRLSGDYQEGEDLAQETFLKAWKAITSYRGQAAFSTWLAAILTNLWRDRLRKKQLSTESLDQKIELGDRELSVRLPTLQEGLKLWRRPRQKKRF